jgi:hypothetical protein
MAMLPAYKFILSQAEIQTHLSACDRVCPPGRGSQPVSLHSVETPRPLAWPDTQTRLLRVYGKHGKL